MNAPASSHQPRWHRYAEEFCGGTGGSFGPTRLTPRIGLALSSGGARGLAHVGVIQVLEENDIPITALAGTSMGAYVGSLFAAGLNARRLEALAAEIKDRQALIRLLDFQFPPTRGLIRGERIRAHLERDLGNLTFEDLKIPSLFVATDLESLDAHVFDSGPVAPAVHASAAIPAVCVPVKLNGRRYTDGGASEPLPASLLRQRFAVDHVIAVNVMPRPADFMDTQDSAFRSFRPLPTNRFRRLLYRLLRPINLMADGNVIDTFHRALMSAQLRLIQKECATADLVIQPRFERSTWHDFENFQHYIQAGRLAAESMLPAIRALLEPPSRPVYQRVPESAPLLAI
jgi:NTE family protein